MPDVYILQICNRWVKIFVLSYVDDFVYWCISEALGKYFVYTPVNIFHVNLLVFSHWFMSIKISHLKYHSISVDQARYATSVVAKCLDTATVKTSTIFYKTTFTSDMVFIQDYVSTIDEQV